MSDDVTYKEHIFLQISRKEAISLPAYCLKIIRETDFTTKSRVIRYLSTLDSKPHILNLKIQLSRVDKYRITLDAVVDSIFILPYNVYMYIYIFTYILILTSLDTGHSGSISVPKDIRYTEVAFDNCSSSKCYRKKSVKI